MPQYPKRGNPHRRPRRAKKRPMTPCMTVIPPLVAARLTLHESDPITGNEERLSTLFYEVYRGYTIYSTEQRRCCIHGKRGGCLRLEGKYACFPDVEEAKTMIKHFQTDGRMSWESMERDVAADAYVCLNRPACRPGNTSSFRLAKV